MPVDNEPYWGSHGDDICNWRSPFTCAIPLTGLSKITTTVEQQLGSTMQNQCSQYIRTEMVAEQSIIKEWVTYSSAFPSTRPHHLHRRFRLRMGSKLNVGTNIWVLDKIRKRRKHQRQRTKGNTLCAQLLLPRYKNCNIKIYSDNWTALKYINKAGGTASEALQELAIQIQQLCNRYKVQLICHHVPGIQNPEADRLSRRSVPLYEWTLPRRWFQQLQRMWGHQSFKIDAFAAMKNRNLPAHWSLQLDPEAQAVDTFNQILPKRGLYLNPLWKLVPKVLRKIDHFCTE